MRRADKEVESGQLAYSHKSISIDERIYTQRDILLTTFVLFLFSIDQYVTSIIKTIDHLAYRLYSTSPSPSVD